MLNSFLVKVLIISIIFPLSIQPFPFHSFRTKMSVSALVDTSLQQREAFAQFVASRNWKFCESYWSRTIKFSSNELPSFVTGSDKDFGVSNLEVIRDAGQKGEFVSKNNRYHMKQNFAMRIGYDGNKYHGYQKQKFCPGLTVEGDLKEALSRNTIGAGRTDRGVSGISQVICFSTPDMKIKPEDLIKKFKESEPYKDGRLAIYDCQRVPKKFHSRASATWRRYLYMFPLNRIIKTTQNGTYNPTESEGPDKPCGWYDSSSTNGSVEYDVDVEVLNRILGKLENRDLPYNAFAFKIDRNVGQGLLDHCILYKARASIVNLADCAPSQPWGPTPTPISIPTPAYEQQQAQKGKRKGAPDADANADADADGLTSAIAEDCDSATTATTGASGLDAHKSTISSKKINREEDDDDDDDEELVRGGASAGTGIHNVVDTTTVELPPGAEVPAICIELVGNRFLRRMVRILTATAIREAVADPAVRNENVLVDICLSGDRELSSRPLPGPPLCLAGVGYDAHDMAIYKFMPKVEYNARMAEAAADADSGAIRYTPVMLQEP